MYICVVRVEEQIAQLAIVKQKCRRRRKGKGRSAAKGQWVKLGLLKKYNNFGRECNVRPKVQAF